MTEFWSLEKRILVWNALSSGASRPRALHLALWTSSRSHCAEESPWEQRVSCTSNSFAVSDFCYRRHQVKESTGMLPQRSHPFTTWDIGLVISIMEDGEQLSPIDKLAGKHLYFAHLGTLPFVCLSCSSTQTGGRGDAVDVPLPSVRNWIWMRLSSRCPKLPGLQNTTIVSILKLKKQAP